MQFFTQIYQTLILFLIINEISLCLTERHRFHNAPALCGRTLILDYIQSANAISLTASKQNSVANSYLFETHFNIEPLCCEQIQSNRLWTLWFLVQLWHSNWVFNVISATVLSCIIGTALDRLSVQNILCSCVRIGFSLTFVKSSAKHYHQTCKPFFII